MSIEKFIEELAKEIEARMVGVKVTPIETWKNNGVFKHGITLRRNGENASPVLYVNQWFERFEAGEISMHDIAEQVIREYEDLPVLQFDDLDSWLSSADLLDKVSIRLVNRAANEDIIKTRRLVYYDVENTDLVCLFHVMVIAHDGAEGTIVLSEELFERYLPVISNVEVLYNEVMKRVETDDIKLESLTKMVDRMIAERGIEFPPISKGEDFMYVLTNKSNVYGAFTILAKASRRLILEKFPGGKVTVLPSSVHEAILIKTQEDEDVRALREMVRQVNHSEISKAEYLSDNVYHYDAKTGELVIAHCKECEVEE